MRERQLVWRGAQVERLEDGRKDGGRPQAEEEGREVAKERGRVARPRGGEVLIETPRTEHLASESQSIPVTRSSFSQRGKERKAS